MGAGILGRTLEEIPVGDQVLRLKDATPILGVACELHDKPPPTIAEFFALMQREGGLDACAGCIEFTIAHLKSQRRRGP